MKPVERHRQESGRRAPHRLTGSRAILGAVGLLLLSAGQWWVWFGWDTQYDVDPITGTVSGPYEVWQVLGCVVSWALIGWVATRRLHPAVVIVLMPTAFTVSFALTAARIADSGLWVVGAILCAVGTSLGTCLLVAVLSWRRRVVPEPAATREPAR